MAANVEGVLDNEIRSKVSSCKILVVGAGGIGCELLKNLVLTGFKHIQVIDLDTIDVSNLNRQFLFRKEHVGKSKAKVARDSALMLHPDADIIAYHDSIMSTHYGVPFFKDFDIVMNALDNRAARNHVNRLCLAADVPLIESGTAGYLGQVSVIKKKVTECYECQPKEAQKTYPGCTIRNTPSEPIHCIVWAKNLFNQLYGEADPDQDVSPDTADPEAAGDAGKIAFESESKSAIGGIERKSTRTWSEEINYDHKKLFNKFFHDDIKYLLSMENLWKKRRPPTPLTLNDLPDSDGYSASGLILDQRVWSIKECAEVFEKSVHSLRDQLISQDGLNGKMLVWDKDDTAGMDFVASVANLRAHIFNIPMKSRFDIKSMAGNIIPAIASTNAVIAGLIVLEALKVLRNKWNDCRTVYLNRQPNARKKLLVPCILDKPSPNCYVCVDRPQITLHVNVSLFSVKSLEEKVLKSALGMVAPDVEIDDGKGTILISSEEGETEENGSKMLSEFCIGAGSRLKCDDFQQDYNIVINIFHTDSLPDDQEFQLGGNLSKVHPENESKAVDKMEVSNGSCVNKPDDTDIMLMDEEEVKILEDKPPFVVQLKRKAPSEDETIIPPKKLCTEDGSEIAETF